MGWMEGPVCTGAIFSKFRRFFFRAGGVKGLTPSVMQEISHTFAQGKISGNAVAWTSVAPMPLIAQFDTLE